MARLGGIRRAERRLSEMSQGSKSHGWEHEVERAQQYQRTVRIQNMEKQLDGVVGRAKIMVRLVQEEMSKSPNPETLQSELARWRDIRLGERKTRRFTGDREVTTGLPCGICFEETEQVCHPCSYSIDHTFCPDCIAQWQQISCTCPLCKQSLAYCDD